MSLGLLDLSPDLLATKIFRRTVPSLPALSLTSKSMLSIVRTYDTPLWKQYVNEHLDDHPTIPEGAYWWNYVNQVRSLNDMKWENIQSPTSGLLWPSPRKGHTLTKIGPSSLLLCFGITLQKNSNFYLANPPVNDPFYVLNCNDYSWQSIPVTYPRTCGESIPCFGHTSVYFDGKVLFYGGGLATGGASGFVFSLDLQSFKLTPIAIGMKSMFHTAVMDGSNMIVYGGIDYPAPGLPPSFLSSHHCLRVFNTLINTWTFPQVSGVLPGPRIHHRTEVHGDHLYLFGGMNNDDERFNSWFRYDLGSGEWSSVDIIGNGLVSPRSSPSLVVLGSCFLILLGRSQSYDQLYDHVWCMNTQSMTISQHRARGQMIPRYTASGCLVGGRVFWFGGSRDVDIRARQMLMADLNVLHLTSFTQPAPLQRTDSVSDLV